ncbi:hypothetical protein ACS0TY_035578 [Phlomoides rotata]
MARSGLIITAALVVALMVATVVPVTEAAERNDNMNCMAECYYDCTQIKIFSDDECKKECVLACAKYAIRKASLEEDDNKFVPLWI